MNEKFSINLKIVRLDAEEIFLWNYCTLNLDNKILYKLGTMWATLLEQLFFVINIFFSSQFKIYIADSIFYSFSSSRFIDHPGIFFFFQTQYIKKIGLKKIIIKIHKQSTVQITISQFYFFSFFLIQLLLFLS